MKLYLDPLEMVLLLSPELEEGLLLELEAEEVEALTLRVERENQRVEIGRERIEN